MNEKPKKKRLAMLADMTSPTNSADISHQAAIWTHNAKEHAIQPGAIQISFILLGIILRFWQT